MLTSIYIENFRCFDALKVKGFAQVNLIAGKNNVGKTAFLEAIGILTSGTSTGGFAHYISVRHKPLEKVTPEIIRELFVKSLFKDFDLNQKASIKGALDNQEYQLEIYSTPSNPQVISLAPDNHKDDSSIGPKKAEHILALRYTEPSGKQTISQIMVGDTDQLYSDTDLAHSTCRTAFIPAIGLQREREKVEMFGQLELVGSDYDLVESLKLIEPRLNRITTIVVSGFPILYGDIGLNRLMPLSLMGEGLNHLTSILLTIASNRQGLVLVDEIENGFHHSVLSKVWEVINDAANRFDVQVIATTHSYECIQAAHTAFSQNEHYDFRLHRIDRTQEGFKVISYDQEILETAIKVPFEVR